VIITSRFKIMLTPKKREAWHPHGGALTDADGEENVECGDG